MRWLEWFGPSPSYGSKMNLGWGGGGAGWGRAGWTSVWGKETMEGWIGFFCVPGCMVSWVCTSHYSSANPFLMVVQLPLAFCSFTAALLLYCNILLCMHSILAFP